MRFCREHQIYVMLAEIVHRHNHRRWHTPSLDKAQLETAIAEAGEYFLGRYVIGEAGGMLYWPKFYTLGMGCDCFPALPPCRNEAEAHDAYVRYLANELEFERHEVCDCPLYDVESSITFAEHAEAGIDGLCLEMCPGDPLVTLAALRGAARATGLPWGVHIAQMWYGGVRVDELYQSRWRSALWLTYLSGAEFIYPECGHLRYTIAGEQNYGFDAPETRRVRRELRNLYRFSRVHRRPTSGPVTPFAVVRGRNDGHPGLWNPYAWGQYESGREWETSDEERGWELFPTLFAREPVFHEYNTGDADHSGNPPAGQVDVIPPSADFSDYSMLFFLGYNDMDEQLYDQLCRYVEAGGHLLISLAQLRVIGERRGGPRRLFRNGDLTRLCGFRVTEEEPADVHGLRFVRQCSCPEYDFPRKTPDRDPQFNARLSPVRIEAVAAGCRVLAGCATRVQDSVEAISERPVLVEHRLGKGLVLTITIKEPIGTPALRDFANELLWAAVRAHRQPFEFLTGDRIRQAFYRREDGGMQFYLLNTDPDLTQGAVPCFGSHRLPELLLPPGGVRIGYLVDDWLILPESELCDLERKSPNVFTLHSEAQRVTLCNLGCEQRTATLNGISVGLAPAEAADVACPADLPADLAEFFSPGYLDEPAIVPTDLSTPY